jgi:hypothetical protein
MRAGIFRDRDIVAGDINDATPDEGQVLVPV